MVDSFTCNVHELFVFKHMLKMELPTKMTWMKCYANDDLCDLALSIR